MRGSGLHIILWLSLICCQPLSVLSQSVVKDWDRTYGGNIGDELRQMTVQLNGDIVLLGLSRSDIGNEKSSPKKAGIDYWLVILDNQSNPLQDYTFSGIDGQSRGSCVLLHSNGSLYIAGQSNSNQGNDKTHPPKENEIFPPTSTPLASQDIWLLRLDGGYNIVWDKLYGGGQRPSPIPRSGFNEAYAVAEMPNGDIIIAGRSDCNAGHDKSEDSRNAHNMPQASSLYDYWLLRLDPDGNVIWDKTLGGDGSDYNIMCNSLVITSTGNILVGGSSDSNISGEKSESPRGGRDFWIVMLDGNGNLIWDKTYGGSGSIDGAAAVLELPSGDFLVGGQSNSPADGDKTTAPLGGADCWLLKIDVNGSLIWQKSYGTSGTDVIQDMILTSDGNVLLLSVSDQGANGDRSEVNRGNFDVWLIKIDPAGAIIWEKSFGGDGADLPRSVIELAPDEFLVGCTSQSNASGEKSEDSRGGEDYWLFKTKPDDALALGGWRAWQALPVGSAAQLSWAFDREVSGGSYTILRGESPEKMRVIASVPATGAASYRWRDAAPPSGWNYYAIEHHGTEIDRSNILSVRIMEPETEASFSLRIYPNPADDHFTLQWAACPALSLELTEPSGRLVQSWNFTGDSGEARLPLDGLPAGLYFCRLRSGERLLEVKKLAKTR